MAGIAIVAIPEEDDPVWKISSEKIPHLTLVYMEGPLENEENTIRYIEHVAKTSIRRFGMSVDRRGVLGEDNADVVFLDKRYGGKELLSARGYFLSNDDIRTAYQKAPQYPIYTPHVTLGYPATPAKEGDKLYWINFDKIAVWTEDFAGPEFELDADRSMELDVPASWAEDEDFGSYLKHFGVRGMKWGVRRSIGPDGLVRGPAPGLTGGSKSGSSGTSIAVTRGKKSVGSADHQQMVKNLNKKLEDLSTSEIRAISNRIKAINDLKKTTAEEKAAKASFGKKLAKWALDKAVEGATDKVGEIIKEHTGEGVLKVFPKSKAQQKRERDDAQKQEDRSRRIKEEDRRNAEREAREANKSSQSRDAAVKDLTDAILKSDGAYEITTKKEE